MTTAKVIIVVIASLWLAFMYPQLKGAPASNASFRWIPLFKTLIWGWRKKIYLKSMSRRTTEDVHPRPKDRSHAVLIIILISDDCYKGIKIKVQGIAPEFTIKNPWTWRNLCLKQSINRMMYQGSKYSRTSYAISPIKNPWTWRNLCLKQSINCRMYQGSKYSRTSYAIRPINSLKSTTDKVSVRTCHINVESIRSAFIRQRKYAESQPRQTIRHLKQWMTSRLMLFETHIQFGRNGMSSRLVREGAPT